MSRPFLPQPLLALLLCVLVIQILPAQASNQFLPPDQAFSHHQTRDADGRVQLHWTVAPGYYLYRSRMQIEGADAPVAHVDKPTGELIHDPYFGDERIYDHDVTVTVEPGEAQRLKLTWQGCAKAGLCYPPQHATVDVSDGTDAAPPAIESPPQANIEQASASAGDDQALAMRLADGASAWTLLAFFGMGLLLSFTPCVLPMVPILSGVIVGAGARGLRGTALSLVFVLPMAITYAVLGVAAALAGANLQAILQTPAVLGAFAAVFVALALAMFGVFELQLPGPLRERLNRASANRRGGHAAGAAALGVISAVLVGPCMTAPLAGALLYIADSGDVVLGGLALLFLGLGMGVPLIVVGALGAWVLPRPGPWMNAVKAVFGFVLLATALWLIGRVTPTPIMLGLWGALLIAAGVALGAAIRRTGAPAGTVTVAGATAAVLLGLWGGLMVIGAAGGARDPVHPLAFLRGGSAAGTQADAAAPFNDRFQTVRSLDGLQTALDTAEQDGQWAVVDFYADWCVSCQVIDRTVFGNARVRKALADARLIRPDVTDDNADTRRLMQSLGVFGPPSILFIGPDGRERRGARVVGELSAGEFLDHWRRAHDQTGPAAASS
ncbi:protein-disulfide reductase DsbD [Salinisphaera sp.]|uniref:protein-disulfide reductase DsbD n=1 Tax=Salinisphaera sp. TaxID=1914330 RepID=UPI002D790E9C|nr:protein-disulfide reductase DsbD [Salinisphaera sp.]HET7313192.1 protein-disulfide reductase DsbD [Salinisphaera sp.]